MRLPKLEHEHTHGATPELQEVLDMALCRIGSVERSARIVGKEVRLMTVVIGLCALAIVAAIFVTKGGNNGN